MKIAIDLDGVVIDLMGSWLRRFHPSYTVNEIIGWNAYDYINISSKQFYRELERLKPEDITLYEDAVKTIYEIDKNHSIYFLTSKTQKMLKWTLQVLVDNALDHIKLCISWNKSFYDFDLLIDDNPKLITDESIRNRLLLFERPWNKNVQERVSTAYNWIGVRNFIQAFNRSI